VDQDSNVQALLDAGVSTVTIVGKSWDFHVLRALETTLEENLAMISDTVFYLKSKGLEVIFDAEHFFDGFKQNRNYALQVLKAAEQRTGSFSVIPMAAQCPGNLRNHRAGRSNRQ
jgi:2-isopropylmalate synthase